MVIRKISDAFSYVFRSLNADLSVKLDNTARGT